MNTKEDRIVPVDVDHVAMAVESGNPDTKRAIVGKILGHLNEKRDAYNCIVSSLIHFIDSNDDELICYLTDGLIDAITSNPMKYGGKMLLSKAVHRLTLERPPYVVNLFEKVITTTESWADRFLEEDAVLKIQIIALKSIRRAQLERKTITTILDQDFCDQLCNRAMLCRDEPTKIDTLCLILESKSTTKVIQPREMEAYRSFFPDALSLQEPSLRQTFLALTNRWLKRLRDSLRMVMRDKLRFSDNDRTKISQQYTSFVTWLVDSCFDSIYCNAYFGSFIISMTTLRLIIDHMSFDEPHLPIKGLFNKRRCYDSLLSCLSDSFEENKTLALNLLLSLPNNDEFLTDENLKQFERVAFHLINSVNPAHSLTCHYIFRLCIGLKLKRNHAMNVAKQTKNKLLLQYLTKLLNLVEEGVEDTRKNLIVAMKYNAIYPKLTCMRALLAEIDINDLEGDRDEWNTLASRLVTASLEACHAVSTIVCNLNPETIGHLPMDQKPIDVEALSKTLNISMNISNDQLQTITSQMLLISGWKTIKECSLSMGTMCTHLWWPRDNSLSKKKFHGLKTTEPILGCNDIKKIIAFFDHYLRNLRHRGAFEQAYYGFIMVTKRIWPDQEFQELLIATLTEIMQDFKSRDSHLDDKRIECLKAYVTRRSAGLPFIVQAILSSEHKHDSKTLRWVMDCLFEILDDLKAETYQRIHCLNILKALIRDSDLSEKVIPYIGKTFSITMRSFDSDLFPIRNCANMLLKATVDRAFGVNRLRDDIHKRNKLSWSKFFSECPGLHSQMLQHLHDGIQERKCLAAVHSVFIILSRLRPAETPADCETFIRPFIKPIEQLAFTCPDYKLRELSAKLVVQFKIYCEDTHDLGQFGHHLRDLLGSISACLNRDNQNRNQLHGLLLLIKNWIDNLKSPNNCEHQEMALETAKHVIRLILVTNNSKSSSNIVDNTIKLVALDIAEVYCVVQPYTRHTWVAELFHELELMIAQTNRPENGHQADIHFENLIFKYVSVLLMSNCFDYSESVTNSVRGGGLKLSKVLDVLIDIVTQSLNRTFSVNIQAAFLRLLRQLAGNSDHTNDEKFLDRMLGSLDIDSTAAHVTPVDRLELMTENDSEREIWAKYCEQKELRLFVSDMPFRHLQRLFNYQNYEEFKSLSDSCLIFKSKSSNTPRGIELLALAYKCWSQFNIDQVAIWYRHDETITDKLNFMSKFICALPDCDIKCFVILCATNLFNSSLVDSEVNRARIKQVIVGETLESYTQVLEESADGHHNFIIRETCGEALDLCLGTALERQCDIPQSCLVNLLSTLIKLSQDEELDIRRRSYRIMSNLRDKFTAQSQVVGSGLKRASSAGLLNDFLSLITSRLFDPNSEQDLRNCFELSMRVIFNHTKNYSTTFNDQREVLFDKTKLNTFADHVAIIQSALDGIKIFFQSSEGGALQLNSLRLYDEILFELETVFQEAKTTDNDGDYNWRLKKCVHGRGETNNDKAIRTPTDGDNGDDENDNLNVNQVLENILKSLDYFSNGYWNMLTDTDYPYHELSLFKRIAFIKFVLDCTKFDDQSLDEKLVEEIRRRLGEITRDSCSTTMLCKCRALICN